MYLVDFWTKSGKCFQATLDIEILGRNLFLHKQIITKNFAIRMNDVTAYEIKSILYDDDYNNPLIL